ncbi:MAG: hypothetical protein ACKOA8_05120, partial [Deltaproteobacteria bacterium]
MHPKSTFGFLFLLLAVQFISGCGNSSSSIGNSEFSGALSAIETSISVAGSSMQTGVYVNSRVSPSDCNQYGYPVVNQADDNYPGHLTYCFLTVDAGDTVRGGFSTPRDLSCLLTKLSVAFDGSAQAFTVTPAMASECNLETERGEPIREEIAGTLTGTAPAAFNTNYAKGVVLDVPALGLVFKIAINSTGSVYSFITNETW